MKAFMRVARLATCVVFSLSIVACAGAGAGPSFSSQPNDQQSSGAYMPQSVGAQALQIGQAEAPPPIPIVPLSIQHGVLPNLTSPIINDSGSYVGGSIIVGTNTGSTGTGVEGIGGSGGYGIMGLAASATGAGAGVYGKATAPSATGVYGYSSKSYGVVGDSEYGNGVYGLAGAASRFAGLFTNTSSTGTALKATATGGVGVSGTSTSSQGVLGNSSSNAGVYGLSSTGSGVQGESTGTGVYGLADSGGSAVYADGASFGTGFGLEAHGFNKAAVYAEADSTAQGLVVQGTETAIEAHTGGGSCTGASCVAIYATNSSGNGSDITGNYIGLLGRAPSGTGAFPLLLTDTSAKDLFYVDGNGDVFYHGSLNTFAILHNGKTATAFSSKTASPTIEDTGSARLSGGSATVVLDPTFAQSMDPQKPYQVMLTPDGDTRGLFVASKSRGSFVVREVQGGHGSLNFDYHIYGPALGQADVRMAIASHPPNSPIVRRAVFTPSRVIRRGVRPH
jgi:hypothetical protein